MEKNPAIGYLPDERPPVWKLLLYAIQQVIVMFPATVAVALITASTSRQRFLRAGLRQSVSSLLPGNKFRCTTAPASRILPRLSV